MPAARLACLPWYELPETRAAQDALWTVIARHLRRNRIDGVPSRLTRGRPVPALLGDPDLLFGQCCGYDVVYGFADCLTVLATPEYQADGCDGSDYRSFVLVRADSPARSLDDLRGATCVVNGFNSHSGTNALRALVAPLSRDGRFFGAIKVSGAHVNSLAHVACRRRRRHGHGLRRPCPSRPPPAGSAGGNAHPLPERAGAGAAIRHRSTGEADDIARMRTALADAFADGDAGAPLATLLLAQHRVPAGHRLCKDRRARGRSARPRLYGTACDEPRTGAVSS